MMNELIEKFIDYATFDEEGSINGISEDASKEAEDAYKEYIFQITQAIAKGLKI
jgi:hypothetical protein